MTYTTIDRVRREGTTHDTINDLAAELLRRQATKKDYVVDTRRMSFFTENGQSTLSFDVPLGAALIEPDPPTFSPDQMRPVGDQPPVHETPGTDGGVVNDHAHNQLAQRLGIPRKYYDRMRVDAGFLLDANVQHWFYKAPERRMIRMLDGNVRAFLSDRFRRLDSYDLMEQAVIPALRDIDGLSFHVASLTPERLVMRAILPSLTSYVKNVGDIVQAGFQVRNSEVGAGALSIEPFIWTLACKNGLVVNSGALRAYHVGRRIEDTEEAQRIFRADTLQADDRAFYLKARDAISAAVDETVFGEIVEQLRAAASGGTIGAPVAATEALVDTFSMGEGERDSILASLAQGGDLTRWGLINAVTDAAKLADTFDRQEEMERVGGALLELPSREWNRIATAA